MSDRTWHAQRVATLRTAWREGGLAAARLAFPDVAPKTILNKVAETGIDRELRMEREREQRLAADRRPRCRDCGAVDFLVRGTDREPRCRDARACSWRVRERASVR